MPLTAVPREEQPPPGRQISYGPISLKDWKAGTMNVFECGQGTCGQGLADMRMTRRRALGLAAVGLACMAGAAMPASADVPAGQTQAAGDVDATSGATKTAGTSGSDATGAASGSAAGEVVASVAVPDGVDDVPADAVDVALPLLLTDDQGREVEVASLDRVVVCMGSFAKTWQLAGGAFVGTTDDALADFDLEGAGGIATVGDFTAPNLEQILALDPTLVIMSASSAGRGGQSSQVDLVAPLEQAGIPVLTFKVTLFGDYLRMLRACCDLTGRYDLYRTHGLATRDRINEILAAVAAERSGSGGEAPTCLIMTTYSGGTRVLNSATQAGAAAADLGAANLADANPSLLKDFSLESVVALDPKFIFVLPMGDDAEAAQRALREQTEDNPAWAGLTAVQEGRFITLDPALFQYKPLDAWDETYRAMARALYGDDVCA